MKNELFIKTVIGVILISLASMSCLSAYPINEPPRIYNLGFEYKRNQQEPSQWHVLNGTLSTDSIYKFSGDYSARLETDTIHPYAMCYQSPFYTTKLVGKNVEIRCKVLCDPKNTGQKILITASCISLDVSPNLIVNGDSISGNQQWKELSLKMKIESGNSQFIYGMVGGKGGTFYIDDVRIFVDGEVFKDFSPRREGLNHKERKWMEKNIIRFDSTTTKFDALGKAVGDAQIVALGEITHGSGTSNLVRAQLAKYLIQEKNFTLIAIEDTPSNVESVNNYVLTGEGSAEESLINTFSWANNKEFASLIEWIRQYNMTAKVKVRVTGIDMQNILSIWTSLNNKSKGVFYPELKKLGDMMENVRKEKVSLHRLRHMQEYFTPQQQDEITSCMEKLRQWAKVNIADRSEYELFVHYTRLLEQNITAMNVEPRNRFMAENIAWLVEQNKGEKIIFIAHNGHVGKGKTLHNRDSGDFLKDMFGDKYYTISTCFYRGTYHASNGLNYNIKELITAGLGMPGSYEYIFQSIGAPMFYLNLRNVKHNSYNECLFRPMLFRALGAVWVPDEFFYTNLSERYDGVVFFEESAGSTRIHLPNQN